MEVLHRRSTLARTRRRLQEGTLTVGFLGGSITDATSQNWPHPLVAWLTTTYPNVRLIVENAAIGATGSDVAVFRAKRDILVYDCDLVFIEYAVNDNAPTETTLRSREGLLRQLLAGSDRDVVLVYTFAQTMYADMLAGNVPGSIAEFETLAEHYALSSIWMGLHALRQVQQGLMRWEEWLPDGLHPQSRGSLSYAEAVIDFLRRELADASVVDTLPSEHVLPVPLTAANWEKATTLAWEQVETEGSWSVQRWPSSAFYGRVLTTSAPGARLRFSFTGRGLALATHLDDTAAELRWQLDDGPWYTTMRERPAWAKQNGWFRLNLLADDLPDCEHRCVLEVVHGDRPECTGTNCRLIFIGIIG